MAAPSAWGLLLVLSTFASADPPARPSPPECFRECDETHCSVDVKCIWDEKPDTDPPTHYQLQWETENSMDEQSSGNSSDGLIHRQHIRSHVDFHVWVRAWNKNGSATSNKVDFSPENILKPPPPTVSSSSQDPLQITWSSKCEHLGMSCGSCDLRYQTEADQDWVKYEEELVITFTVVDPEPATVYKFQVRCACDSTLKSDWSEIYKIKSAGNDVDLWRDCTPSFSGTDCFLVWKDLSISQGIGKILGYKVTIFYKNNSVSTGNRTNDTKWQLDTSLKDVSSVSVSAYSVTGFTNSSHLFFPVPDAEVKNQTIQLEMSENLLAVSWEPTSQVSQELKQFVVEYKECPPGRGFDWVKVKKSQKAVHFKGRFKNFTQYRVSLFAFLINNTIHHLSTDIIYSVQGVPPEVSSFAVLSYGATDATLFWKPISCSEQNGVILYYQIGVDMQKVYNITAFRQNENQTFTLQNLKPGQDYEVWIRAATAVGPGPKVSKNFKTLQHKQFAYLVPVVIAISILVFIFFCLVLLCTFMGKKAFLLLPKSLYDKVPDPGNSQIFKNMKHQMSPANITDPLTWIGKPMSEPFPKISVLEVLETKSPLDDRTLPGRKDVCLEMDIPNDQREDLLTDFEQTDHRFHRKEYSKMVDSDEERDDCYSSSEEEQLTSGYEKHFMPTAFEILVDS